MIGYGLTDIYEELKILRKLLIRNYSLNKNLMDVKYTIIQIRYAVYPFDSYTGVTSSKLSK